MTEEEWTIVKTFALSKGITSEDIMTLQKDILRDQEEDTSVHKTVEEYLRDTPDETLAIQQHLPDDELMHIIKANNINEAHLAYLRIALSQY